MVDEKDRDKAEGDRMSPGEMSPPSRAGRDGSERNDKTEDEGGGITNRPLDQEIDNQESLPERGTNKEEQDPALPSNDPTLKTTI